MKKTFKFIAFSCAMLMALLALTSCARTKMEIRRTSSSVMTATRDAYQGFMARYYKPMIQPYGFCNRFEAIVSCSDVHLNGHPSMLVPTIADFHGVTVNGVFNVNLVADSNFSEVEVEGDTAILQHVTFIVDPDGILHINMHRGYRYPEFARADVTIHLPKITYFGYTGFGHVNLTGIDSEFFTLEANGGGYITASGVADRVGISLRGTSGLDAMGMNIGVLYMNTGEYAHAKVKPKKHMTAVTADGSNIHYYGRPETANVIGLNGGQVIPMEDHYFAPHGLPPYK